MLAEPTDLISAMLQICVPLHKESWEFSVAFAAFFFFYAILLGVGASVLYFCGAAVLSS
jgi:hypothetical protein